MRRYFMKKKILQVLKSEKGASELVEVALVFPIIIILLIGFVYFMIALRETVVVESAVRSGARTLGITKEIDEAIARAHAEIDAGKISSDVNIVPGDNEESIVGVTSRTVRIPFGGGQHVFDTRREAAFHEEEEPFFYNNPPDEQRSPVDGSSGYTGNPYL